MLPTPLAQGTKKARAEPGSPLCIYGQDPHLCQQEYLVFTGVTPKRVVDLLFPPSIRLSAGQCRRIRIILKISASGSAGSTFLETFCAQGTISFKNS